MNQNWQDLIQRHLSGLCTPEETETLQDALRHNDQVADLYLSHVNLDVALEGTAAGSELLEAVCFPPQPIGKPIALRRTWIPQASAIAACLALALALICWRFTNHRAPWATLLSAGGGVEIVADGTAKPGPQGAALLFGQRLRVEDLGGAVLAVRGLGRVTLGPEAVLHPAREPRVLELDGGFIEIEADPQPAHRPWRIRTPQAEAAVIGTKFSLAAADTRTVLRVSEGLVRLTGLSSGKTESVSSGSRAFVTGNSPPAVAGSRPGSVLLLTSRTTPDLGWDRFNRLIGDKLVDTRLWRLGFKVEIKHFDEVSSADLRDRALVIVSIFPDGVGEPVLERIGLAAAGMPVICLEPAGYPTLGMVRGGPEPPYGFVGQPSPVAIAPDPHPLLKDLTVPSTSWLRTMQGWGCPVAEGAHVLAHLPGQPNRAVWFAYENGAVMAAPANRAPARRVGLFLDPRSMTDPASPVWQVFETSVDWSVSLENPPPTPP